MARWTMKKAENVDFIALRRMTEIEIEQLTRFLINIYASRMKRAKKSGDIPFGLEKIANEWAEHSIILSSLTGVDDILNEKGLPFRRNALIALASYLNTALRWESSTIPGWKRIVKKQDIMLFGSNKKGKPRYSLTNEQRKKFWRAIDEIRARGNTALYYGNSDPLKSTDFSILWESGDEIWSDPVALMDKISELLNKNQMNYPEYTPGEQSDPFGPVPVFGINVFKGEDFE